MIVIAVEDDGGPVARWSAVIATKQLRADQISVGVVHPHRYVDGLSVGNHAGFGALAAARAGTWLELTEIRSDLGGRPDGVIELAVENRRVRPFFYGVTRIVRAGSALARRWLGAGAHGGLVGLLFT